VQYKRLFCRAINR